MALLISDAGAALAPLVLALVACGPSVRSLPESAGTGGTTTDTAVVDSLGESTGTLPTTTELPSDTTAQSTGASTGEPDTTTDETSDDGDLLGETP